MLSKKLFALLPFLLLLFCFILPTSAQATTQTFGPYTFQNYVSGLCMDVTSNSHTVGALIEAWPCNGQTNQLFSLIRDTSWTTGVYQIKPQNTSPNLCLDVYNNDLNENGLIDQYTCFNPPHTNQQWFIYYPFSDGYSALIYSKSTYDNHNPMCISENGSQQGTVLWQKSCVTSGANHNQVWLMSLLI